MDAFAGRGRGGSASHRGYGSTSLLVLPPAPTLAMAGKAS